MIDTIYLVPFLFATYLMMEWLEHKTGARTQETIKRAGAAGPLAGSLLGIIPQCGFSAVAATLYAGRVVTLGTLFAVFLSTSDEMLPVFIAGQVSILTIVKVLGAKVVIGMVMGFIVDAVLRILSRDRQQLRIHELCERDECDCKGDCPACVEHPELVYEHHDASEGSRGNVGAGDLDLACTGAHVGEYDHEGDRVSGHAHAREREGAHGCDHAHADGWIGDHAHADGSARGHACGHDHSCGRSHVHDGEFGWAGIARSALVHTVKVTAFIFVITFALNVTLELVGEDALAGILAGDSPFSIFVAALVGLVPNCAASVAIAQLYAEGLLGAGAMMAGLLVSAGVGLLVLVRSNRRLRENMAIVFGMYVTGVMWGLIIGGLGITF